MTIKEDEPKQNNTNSSRSLNICNRKATGRNSLSRPEVGRPLIDEALQHHHQAPRLLAQGAVRVVLQEGKQLLSDLGQNSGHVVSGQGVGVVQIHHSVLQVAAHTDRSDTAPPAAQQTPGSPASPDLELRTGCEVRGELLDERQQHGLAEGAGVLPEHLLGLDGLTHVQHQVQVCGRERLDRKSHTNCRSGAFYWFY